MPEDYTLSAAIPACFFVLLSYPLVAVSGGCTAEAATTTTSWSSGGAIGSATGEPGGGEGARRKAAGTQASSPAATHTSRVGASASATVTSDLQVKGANKRHALPPLETGGVFRSLPIVYSHRREEYGTIIRTVNYRLLLHIHVSTRGGSQPICKHLPQSSPHSFAATL